jgi:phosphoglycerate dehydrogenase-like enzyme
VDLLSNSFRIVNIEPLPDWIGALFDSALAPPDFKLSWATDLNDLSVSEIFSSAAAIVTGKTRVTEKMMRAAAPDLRLIQVVGRAPWAVDLDCAREAGVQVSFLPHRGAIAVAEHTLALLVGLMRKLVAGHTGTVGAAYQQLGVEPKRTSERAIAFNWLGFPDVQQLFGKTIGLVGLGDIGLEVARRARAFDMNVLYTKRSPLPPEYDEMVGVRYAPFEELIEHADVISLHSPHTEETEGLICADVFARMKNSAVLINTARGGLVDEDALVEALSSGIIAGAGLDCFIDEPLPVGHGLMDLENVVLSPHVGGGTGGGQKGVVADVKLNMELIRSGETPHYLVLP